MARGEGGTVCRGRTVKKGDLCEIFGVTLPTVNQWLSAGCPCISRGGRGVASEFNTADVSKWLRDRARDDGAGTSKADETELKRRKLQAETEIVELELAKARGQVAPLDQVERMVSRAFGEVRAGLRNIPSRVVSSLIGETNERQFKKVLLEEIDMVLTALANADLSSGDEDEEDGEIDDE